MNISNETLKILSESGWYEGRKIDITEFKDNLKQIGYTVFQPVKDFIEEFGDLVVKDTINEEVHDTSVKFTSYYANGSFKSEENYAQERLVPVGKVDSDYLILFVSESGKVYCSTGKLGDSAMEAWENLISGNGGTSWGES